MDRKKYEVTGTVENDKKVVVSGADVKLMKGKDLFGETTTTNGMFTIPNVSNGTYNLVVTSKGGIIVTTIIVISGNDYAAGTITLPIGKTNSVVLVEDNAPQIVVGGLDKQFSKIVDDKDDEKGITKSDNKVVTDGGCVEIKLTAEGKIANTAPNASDISATASSNGKTVGQFIDLSVLKTVTTTDAAVKPTITHLSELQDFVEIFIPLDASLQGKSDYVIYRYHGTGVDTITTSILTDVEKIEMVDSKTIKLTAKKFSTYAIAYKETTTGGGTTGGGGSTGGTTGGGPGKPEITKPIPPIAKPLPQIVKPLPQIVKPMPKIVKPLPPKKQAKSPQTGDNTPMSLPITFATLGLALMALGFYLKGKEKQQSAE